MKTTLLIHLFVAAYFCGFTQKVLFGNQLDTSYYYGNVKTMQVFEYSARFSERANINNKFIEGVKPIQAYHYNIQKQLLEVINYKGDSVLSTSQFIYDEKRRLKYEVRNKKNKIKIFEYENNQSVFERDGIVKLDLEFTYSNDYNVFIKTGGVDIIQYHYCFDEPLLLISSANGEPSTKIRYDEFGHAIEVEDYYYENGQMRVRKEQCIYDDGRLRLKKRYLNNKTIIDSISYDNHDRVLIEKTTSDDSSLCRVSRYDYRSNDTVVIAVYDANDKLTQKIEKTINGDSFISKTMQISPKGISEKTSEIIEFKDGFGNIIKRYSIDYLKKKVSIYEYQFSYY
jgi:hypothetical protein